MEQLDLHGGPPVPAGPPVVPAVVFYADTTRHNCEGAQIPCRHCQMNAHRFQRREPVEGWTRNTDVVILKAVTTITHRDGSTLSLCAQHARQYDERGERDG